MSSESHPKHGHLKLKCSSGEKMADDRRARYLQRADRITGSHQAMARHTTMSDRRTRLLLPITLLAVATNAAAQTFRVERLRTENMVNPIGIDVPAPRLSWMLAADRRGTMQSAYEIRITGDRGVAVWNSGKVVSDESVNRVYGGPALAPGKRYTWRVRAWDDRGRASDWSAPASWETGLMGAANWKAKWIEPGLAEDTTRSNPSPLLRTAFTLNGPIASARVYV